MKSIEQHLADLDFHARHPSLIPPTFTPETCGELAEHLRALIASGKSGWTKAAELEAKVRGLEMQLAGLQRRVPEL